MVRDERMAKSAKKDKCSAPNGQYNYLLSISKRLGKYTGEWVGLVGKRIVAHDKDARVVYKKIMALFPGVEPYIFKVPDDRVYLL